MKNRDFFTEFCVTYTNVQELHVRKTFCSKLASIIITSLKSNLGPN